MRILIGTIGLILALAGTANRVAAQTGRPPTRTATESTAAEEAALQAGTKLHDEGKFDEAIAKYEEVLKANPTNMTALYELAYSYLGKKDMVKAREAAIRGTDYRSEMLPMFYDLLGESYDAAGEPEKAIEMYKLGIRVVPDASQLYFNMGITYLESLKKPDEARNALEQAVAVDPTQPTIHMMLGQVFRSNGYDTPALLAFGTALVFEPTGPRSLQAIGLWRAILRGGLAASSGAPGGGNAGADAAMRGAPSAAGGAGAARPARKTDEGDFAAIDAQYAVGQQKVVAAMDGGAGEMPPLLAQVDDIFTRLAARPAAGDAGTFVGRHYLPYYRELKQKGYVEPFVYWILQRAPITGVRDWLNVNRPRVQEFLDWTNKYKWPTP